MIYFKNFFINLFTSIIFYKNLIQIFMQFNYIYKEIANYNIAKKVYIFISFLTLLTLLPPTF